MSDIDNNLNNKFLSGKNSGNLSELKIHFFPQQKK